MHLQETKEKQQMKHYCLENMKKGNLLPETLPKIMEEWLYKFIQLPSSPQHELQLGLH